MSGLPRNPLKDAEKARLAKALRDNLKRRKAQARGRAPEQETKAPSSAEGKSPAEAARHPSNSDTGVED